MKNKTKQRKRYTQKPRQDYRQGGRVSYQTGRMVQEREMERQGIDPASAPQPIEQRTTLQEARQRPVGLRCKLGTTFFPVVYLFLII